MANSDSESEEGKLILWVDRPQIPHRGLYHINQNYGSCRCREDFGKFVLSLRRTRWWYHQFALQFINRLTPGDFGIENTSLSVGISGFDEYPVKIGGKTITLVDTPGADTTEAIFEETIRWLEQRDSPWVVQLHKHTDKCSLNSHNTVIDQSLG